MSHQVLARFSIYFLDTFKTAEMNTKRAFTHAVVIE